MDTKEVKKLKTGMDILEVAANDKENLSFKTSSKKKSASKNGRIKLGRKDNNISISNNKNAVELKNEINKLKADDKLNSKASKIIIATDLTSDEPSEKYWEKLAESRRVALESALKENVDLNNKLSEMEYENVRLKEMLKEAQTLVEVLTEMLEGNQNEKSESDAEEQSILEESNLGDSENESFQSCI